MPAKLPANNHATAQELTAIGKRIRTHRKAMGITATAAAEAAGMSRITLHRIEAGVSTVTIGAYVSAMQALGLKFVLQDAGTTEHKTVEQTRAGWIPVRLVLQDYPELKRLAWHIQGVDTLTPAEALGIYERNWRHLDRAALTPSESALIDGLRLVYANTDEHV
mgnify:FL=1